MAAYALHFDFLFLFLPLALASYYLLQFRRNLKNYWLLADIIGIMVPNTRAD